jgi:hypothetical protein
VGVGVGVGDGLGGVLAATLRVNDLFDVRRFLSTTWMVKLNVPAVVGVPEIAPLEGFSETPAANEPAASDHV